MGNQGSEFKQARTGRVLKLVFFLTGSAVRRSDEGSRVEDD